MNALRLILIFAAATLLVTGCNTPDPENVAERPWNGQQGWQTGLPSTINQGR